MTAAPPDLDPAILDWHALHVSETVEHLDSHLRDGLGEGAAARRLEHHGPNRLATVRPRSAWDVVAAQFRSPLILILVGAAVVTVATGEFADAAVIAVVLVINAVLGTYQELRADRAVNALMEIAAPRARVVRDGSEQEVDAADLVVGDLVLLGSGTRVPADLRLSAAQTLEVDESLLTGESLPVAKSTDPVPVASLPADRSGVAFMGTVVTSGRGRGLVVGTAARSELGRIATSIRAEERPRTPLQRRMAAFANLIGLLVLAATVVTFVLGLVVGEPPSMMFRTAVALAVAVVPEGLPVAFTVALALGVHRMARRHAVVRSLPAVETLGSTDVIGSDKTGTLTANRMTVQTVWMPSRGYLDVAAASPSPSSSVAPATVDADLVAVLRSAVLTSEAHLDVVDGEVVERRGDPTETALLEAALAAGQPPADLRRDTRVLAAQPFESERQYAAVVVDEDGPVLRCKGAPERLLALSAAQAGPGGPDGPDGPAPLDRDAVLEVAEEMAGRGLRVLATAELRLAGQVDAVDPGAPLRVSGLVLTGLVGMHDPPRTGVAEAIAHCQAAGVRVVMVTGDHAATARAIAAEVGIAHAAGVRVLTGHDLQQMDDDGLREIVDDIDVFARVTPEHKLRVVRALQSHGQVVAVTGDGVNDGPALKAADLGVAMGRSGTDVAREASDMVLTDDAFVSIAAAVEEGRVVFANLRKVTYFLLSTGIAAIVAILGSMLAGLPLPYTPAALLWLNLVTSGVQDVALAFEPAEPDVLEEPPRVRTAPIVDRVLWERTVLTGAVMALGSLWLFVWARAAGLGEASAQGAALTALVVAMTAHVYNARSDRRSVLATRFHGNRLLLVSSIVALVAHVAALNWSPTQQLLRIGPVPWSGWWRILVVAAAVVSVSEVHKAWRRGSCQSPPAVVI